MLGSGTGVQSVYAKTVSATVAAGLSVCSTEKKLFPEGKLYALTELMASAALG